MGEEDAMVDRRSGTREMSRFRASRVRRRMRSEEECGGGVRRKSAEEA